MKILYLINSETKTSIPLMWAEFIGKVYRDNKVTVFSFKKLMINIFSLKRNFDIVHGHHAKSMFFFLLLNKILHMKTVYTIHGSYLYLSKKNKEITNYIFKKADHIVFVNKILFDVIPDEQKAIISDKYSIILNGVDYNYQFERIDVYQKYNISHSDIVLFHPARFVVEKNHVNIIKAFKSIVVQNSNIKLILAGDGKLRPEIERTIQENNLHDNVKLIGIISREEVFNFLDRCDLFLMPSISEGLNVSFLEAFSRRATILVSNIEQFVFPLKHFEIDLLINNIILVDPLNVQSIKEGIQNALSLKRVQGEANRCFSLEKMVESYFLIYKNIIH